MFAKAYFPRRQLILYTKINIFVTCFQNTTFFISTVLKLRLEKNERLNGQLCSELNFTRPVAVWYAVFSSNGLKFHFKVDLSSNRS